MKNGFLSVLIGVMMMSGVTEARSAGSGLLFTVNAFIENAKYEQSGQSTETKRLYYDLKLGKVWGQGLYLGAIYSSESDKGSSTQDGSAYGPSIGYMGSSGMFIQGHYLMKAKYGDYDDGSGYQVDLGYLADVSSSVVLGVEMRYRAVEYKELSGIGIDGYKISRLIPMLTIGFIF